MAAEDTAPRVSRAGDRFTTLVPGRTTRHSFSFGSHYDPGNVGIGALVCLNDDLVAGGHGYDEHPHQDLEIVTWVLDGTLRHTDTRGTAGDVVPGLVQLLSAGRGVRHSERNADADLPVRFLQMWVLPDETGTPPSYAHADVAGALSFGGWVTLASGLPRHRDLTAVALGSSKAALHVARPAAGAGLTLPPAPRTLAMLVRGTAVVEGVGRLGTGDTLRLADDGGRRLVAGEGAELLVWELHPG